MLHWLRSSMTGVGFSNLCAAITYGSAATEAPLVSDPAPPSKLAPAGDPDNPQQFLPQSIATCADWLSSYLKFDADTAAWRRDADPSIPVANWTPEQAVRVRRGYSYDDGFLRRRPRAWEGIAAIPLSRISRAVSAVPSCLYHAISTYAPADNYLVTTSTNVGERAGARL